ncbi:MAG TPA: hypothetical protein VGB45_08350 [Abditibacterium sp.]|jgi:hypothetical protein
MQKQKRMFGKSWPLAIVLGVMPVVALGSGCSGGGIIGIPTPTPRPTPTPSLTVSQLVGNYREISITAPSGQTVNCPGRIDSINEGCGADERIIIASTGSTTGTLNYPPQQDNPLRVTEPFTLSGNRLTLGSGSDAEPFDVTLSGRTLRLREISTGVTFTFTKL